ncbi:MAG: hypothetical protein HY978_00545 [Candidatus Liptonbacteria bacterium]|nr:hypothetical protein [Candidatus Liptonbacteria bacterium]
MKEKIKHSIQNIRRKYPKTSIVVAAVLLSAVAGTFAYSLVGKKDLAKATAEGSAGSDSRAEGNLLVAVAGADNIAATGSGELNSSWPGEVLSYGNVLVQPEREGTIVEWRVKIGERVAAGQMLARLSAPPSMPELVKMLAEQSEGLARARAQAATTERFTEKNKEQLNALLKSAETTTGQAQDVLAGRGNQAGSAKAAVDKARSAVVAMKKNIHTMLEQMLAKHINMVASIRNISPSTFNYGGLNRSYGMLDSQNQYVYETRLIGLIRELQDPDGPSWGLVTDYFDSFTRLAVTTPGEDMPDIRMMAREDQEKFLDMTAKYRDAEAEVAMKETEYALMSSEKTMEYAESKRMVEEKISENDKMLSMARAEVAAAEAAYAAVSRSITGGLAITAPQAGTVSTITKNIGDFVGPGMPVASITTGGDLKRFVRLRIPSNVQMPKPGAVLSVVRPGFSQDVQKVTITGVGMSLDEAGSYLADATLTGMVDWPVGASVRVVASGAASTPIIKLSSVWWSEEGVPHIWGVSEAGRIFGKKITIGRTLGTLIEVYQGLKNGDRYILNPTKEVQENALLEDITPKDVDSGSPAKSSDGKPMGGMEM